MTPETDPTGLPDRVGLIVERFTRSLEHVCRNPKHGAGTPSPAISDHIESMRQRLLLDASGQRLDPATEVAHLSHAAWHAYQAMELMLRERG